MRCAPPSAGYGTAMCKLDWDDYATVWDDTWRKARKEHKCHACRGRIAPGERYLVNSVVFEGTAASEKMCAACDALMVEFGKVDGHPPRTTPGSLADYITECINEDEDQVYDEEKDEYIPGPEAKRWIAMLEEMKARKEQNA